MCQSVSQSDSSQSVGKSDRLPSSQLLASLLSSLPICQPNIQWVASQSVIQLSVTESISQLVCQSVSWSSVRQSVDCQCFSLPVSQSMNQSVAVFQSVSKLVS